MVLAQHLVFLYICRSWEIIVSPGRIHKRGAKAKSISGCSVTWLCELRLDFYSTCKDISSISAVSAKVGTKKWHQLFGGHILWKQHNYLAGSGVIQVVNNRLVDRLHRTLLSGSKCHWLPLLNSSHLWGYGGPLQLFPVTVRTSKQAHRQTYTIFLLLHLRYS
jgi:hypothetical protein